MESDVPVSKKPMLMSLAKDPTMMSVFLMMVCAMADESGDDVRDAKDTVGKGFG